MPTATYTEAEKKTALLELARLNGKVTEAEESTGVARQTLSKWRKEYHEFYLRAAADNASEIEERTVADLRERLDAANDLEAVVILKLEESIEHGPPLKATDLANIYKAIAVVKAINADKILKLTGRPASLPQGSVADLIERLTGRGIIVDVEPVTKKSPAALTAGLPLDRSS